MSILRLATGTNGEGYFHALQRTWSDTNQPLKGVVSKSSLCEFRDRVDYKFFEDIFRQGVSAHKNHRRTYRGFHVYAIDGDQLELPASSDVLKNGYRGWQFANNQETHYPKMYAAQAFDVVNDLIIDFAQSSAVDEVHLARKMVQGFEKNSITLYDRLHCGFDSFYAHREVGNYFVVRARTNGLVHHDVKHFVKSNKRSANSLWRSRNEKRKKTDLHLRLVKVKNPKTKVKMIFVTNLPKKLFSNTEIGRLYQRRWDIEGSFRDQTPFMKIGQFHSNKINGIKQEIYALLWLINGVKASMNHFNVGPNDWLNDAEYRKSNFKFAIQLVTEHMQLLVRRKSRQLQRILEFWMKRTLETRHRNKRAYPRVVRHRGREYAGASLIPNRPL